MNLKRKIIGLICILPFLSSCNDFLNVKDESAVNSDIWNNETTAMYFVNRIYSLSYPRFGGDYIFDESNPAANSDETTENTTLLLGNLESGKIGAYSADNYVAIRYVNIAFDEMKNSTLSEAARNRIEGQLYFFRAWQHWRMVLMHGGVPYMTQVVNYDTEEAIKSPARNKTSECIQYIKEDLEKAIEMLPSTWDEGEWGRVTNATAAALLGRILLFYASPQFTPDQTSAEARQRWQDAYEANKKAEDVAKAGGYGLLDCTTNPTDQWPAPADINKIFLTEGFANIEALFVRVYNTTDSYHGYEESVRPGSLTDKSTEPSNLPSLNLMKAFPNADGSPYTGSDTDVDYWKDRDSRFYSTIIYNGAYVPYSGNANYRQWTYSGGDDSRGPTSTGFYTRKMLNPNTEVFSKTGTNWIELRFGEVLLNLAEAAFEIGDKATTYRCLSELRKRAGIRQGANNYGLGPVSGSDITIELIMNERFIELAFEGKRFYDLRRRNMFTNDLGSFQKLNGQKKPGWRLGFALNGISVEDFNEIRDGLSMEEVSEYTTITKKAAGVTVRPMNYITATTPEDLATRTSGSYNFFDVQDGIITRSPAVLQTMGWPYDQARGNFNPFE